MKKKQRRKGAKIKDIKNLLRALKYN